MKSRGLVVMLALILATLATAGVFLYARGVREDARTGGNLITVVVSRVDIPANTDLNPLIGDGRFSTIDVPRDAVVADAVTDLAQLRNRRNSVFIVAGEQIPLARVQGDKIEGGVLSIPEGHQALTVSVAAPRAIGAAIAGGDNLTIYATFNGVVVRRGGQQPTTTSGTAQESVSATTVLVPEVEVLRVSVPTATSGVSGSETGQDLAGNIAVTLAFQPEEAQKFVFALEQGSVYFSLLPPGADGVQLPPLTVNGIINPRGQNR